MLRPYNVSLNLFRGAALLPFASTTILMLAGSALEACALAEQQVNLALPDIEYAAASTATPVWQPGPVSAELPIALAA